MTDENNSTGKVNFNEVSNRRSLHLLPSFPLELFLPTTILETFTFLVCEKFQFTHAVFVSSFIILGVLYH